MLIGIDLGTTNSAVAIWQSGTAELIPNALGELLTPSAVSVGRDGVLHIGAAALDRMAIDPENTATSFKRLMGTAQTTSLGGKTYKAEDLPALILRSLAEDVRAYTGNFAGPASKPRFASPGRAGPRARWRFRHWR